MYTTLFVYCSQMNLTDECEVYGADGCSCHVCQWTDRGLISRYGCTKKQFFTFQSYNFTLTGTNDYGSTTSNVHVHTDLTIGIRRLQHYYFSDLLLVNTLDIVIF